MRYSLRKKERVKLHEILDAELDRLLEPITLMGPSDTITLELKIEILPTCLEEQ